MYSAFIFFSEGEAQGVSPWNHITTFFFSVCPTSRGMHAGKYFLRFSPPFFSKESKCIIARLCTPIPTPQFGTSSSSIFILKIKKPD